MPSTSFIRQLWIFPGIGMTKTSCTAVLGTVLFVFRPLSSDAIDLVAGLPNGRHSISIVSQPGCLLQQSPTVRPLHPSFGEFLQNCGPRANTWNFKPEKHHCSLPISCLNRLRSVLRRNMCNLSLSVDHIPQNLPDDITYTCTFWVDHICATKDDEGPRIVEPLQFFLFNNLLN